MNTPIRHVDANGARLGYTVSGQGKPLVFVHGYTSRSTGTIYQEFLEFLARDFTVYALDLRGHGASIQEHTEWSVDALADDVAAFVDALGLKGAFYVGHSIGGFTGMLTEIRHPGTFAALSLIATAAAVGGRGTPKETADHLVTNGRNPDVMREFFRPMYVGDNHSSLTPSIDAAVLLDPRLHQAFFAQFPNFDITDRLAEIRVPVLLLNGARDIVISPADQHQTALGLPSYKEIVFSHHGHMLPLEAPALAAREVRSFYLNDLPDSAYGDKSRNGRASASDWLAGI